MTTELWDVHEIELAGPAEGNPFQDVQLAARFWFGHRSVEVDGFYDCGGVYRVRFMPDAVGEWRWETRSNVAALDLRDGSFVCTPAESGNHGPVRVAREVHFEYVDGTPYRPFGTTCYHWTHEVDEKLEQQTLDSLATSPYNKVRMCLLPTQGMTPPMLAFVGDTPGQLDKTRFNPAFFAHLERRIWDLRDLNIEADLILFHPYDKGHWGVDNMTPDEDLHYLRYVIARLGAYRNVWWSIANEYDFNRTKTLADWHQLLQFVQRRDPYQRLRSIHNGTKMYTVANLYDFTRPWITHQSIQHWDARLTSEWLRQCRKPVVIDEICYEGNAERRWGNITGRELVHRFWEGVSRGGYVGHGECFTDRPAGPWVSRGGELYGESTSRIAFLRDLVEAEPDASMIYVGRHQPAYQEVSTDGSFEIDIIDAWNMTVTSVPGTHQGTIRVRLPKQSHLALRLRHTASRRLSRQSGAVTSSADVHVDGTRFRYTDGRPFLPFGITALRWHVQPASSRSATLKALADSPFNKVRMHVLDAGELAAAQWAVERLHEQGLQAEVLLAADIERIVTGLAPYPNVWWSIPANDEIARLVQELDGGGHLLTAPGSVDANHGAPWMSHASVRADDVRAISRLTDDLGKPVLVDECGAEGDAPDLRLCQRPEDMVLHAWEAFCRGGGSSHAEMYGELPWSVHGGDLGGAAIPRIAYLQGIVDAAPPGLRHDGTYYDAATISVEGEWHLQYHGPHRFPHRRFTLPDGRYEVDIIDTWNMTIVENRQVDGGEVTIQLPVEEQLAIRIRRCAR